MEKAPLIRDGSLWMQAVLLSQYEAMRYRLVEEEERENACWSRTAFCRRFISYA